MKIIVKDVGKSAEIIEVEKLEYEDMKELVGGYIECLNVRDDIDMWLNEEGKLIPLPTNLFLCSPHGDVLDTIQGKIFFTSLDDEGDTIGLTDEQASFVMSKLDGMHSFITIDPIYPDNSLKRFPAWEWDA